MAFRRFAEMGFSKIESQHKSQHATKSRREAANKEQIPYNSNENSWHIIKESERGSEIEDDAREPSIAHRWTFFFLPCCMFSFRIKNVSSIRCRFRNEKRKTFGIERMSQPNFVKIFFVYTCDDAVGGTGRERNGERKKSSNENQGDQQQTNT